MRITQDKLSAEIIEEIINASRSERNVKYIIVSVCIVAVYAYSGFIVYLIVLVIRDKSRVLSVFAEVTKEEIDQVLEKAKLVSISSKRFSIEELKNHSKPADSMISKKKEMQQMSGMTTIKLPGPNKDELELLPIKETKQRLFHKLE
jgi:hypothetical protein